MLDLLVIGDCNPDLLVSGGDVVPAFGQREKVVGDARLVVGGSAAITACGAARLGLATGMAAVVGDDLFGRFMLDSLAERGVDVTGCAVDPAVPTGLTVALIDGGDRAMLTASGTIRTLAAEHLSEGLLAGARHVHVGSYYLLDRLRPDLPRLLAVARTAGAGISIDPQGDATGAWGGGLRELLPAIDILFVNEDEERALRPAGCPLVVVKMGERGAAVRWADGELRVPAFSVDSVDATGAGDSFDAGFLAARLAGEGLEHSLRLACACGALSTRAMGGTAGQPTLDQARALL